MVRRWIRDLLGLEAAVKRQKAAVAHESDVQKEQQQAKEEVIKKTNEVSDRVEELRRQTDVIQREYPELRVDQ